VSLPMLDLLACSNPFRGQRTSILGVNATNVVQVEIFVDGAPLSTQTMPPFLVTTLLSTPEHPFIAKVTDSTGNSRFLVLTFPGTDVQSSLQLQVFRPN
jgi:hypothetical protein